MTTTLRRIFRRTQAPVAWEASLFPLPLSRYGSRELDIMLEGYRFTGDTERSTAVVGEIGRRALAL